MMDDKEEDMRGIYNTEEGYIRGSQRLGRIFSVSAQNHSPRRRPRAH